MQALWAQLQSASPERAQAIASGDKISTTGLRRLLEALQQVPFRGRHSSQANLWLLLKTLGREPKLNGASWSGAAYIYPRHSLLGEGSFASVYQCGGVALKQLKSKHRSSREVDILRILEHPHIIQLLDWWYEAGKLVILTSLARGKPLCRQQGSRLRPLKGQERLEVVQIMARQLFSAIGYMHTLGIVHRDVKPSNLVWDPEHQQLVLLDLGLANWTDTGMNWHGTLSYSLAETWRKRFKPFRPQLVMQNDVWACWASLWAVLTGSGPYHGIATGEELKELFLRDDAEIVDMLGWAGHPCDWPLLRENLCALSAAQPLAIADTEKPRDGQMV